MEWQLAKMAVQALRAKPKLTVKQWADKNRILSQESSAEPGRWYTERAYYHGGIMDAFSEPRVEKVVCMTAAQVGKTEILNNVLGYYIEQDPSPVLFIQPTLDIGKAWSKDRFAPMLRDTKSLQGLVKDVRSRDSDNTVLHKKFPGGHITIAGAFSPTSLASRPIRVVLCDEIDRTHSPRAHRRPARADGSRAAQPSVTSYGRSVRCCRAW